MLLGIDPNGGTGMSGEWAMRLAIEELKNLWQLLLADRLLNGSTRCDARMSEDGEKDLLDLDEMRQGEWLEEPARHDPSRES
jgi:hypothetical protein